MPRDYYEVLNVDRGADEATIKKSFRRLARELHPDVNAHDPDAEEKFKEAAAAYEVLSDPERRRLYDSYGEDGLRGRGYAPDMDAFGGMQLRAGWVVVMARSTCGQKAHGRRATLPDRSGGTGPGKKRPFLPGRVSRGFPYRAGSPARNWHLAEPLSVGCRGFNGPVPPPLLIRNSSVVRYIVPDSARLGKWCRLRNECGRYAAAWICRRSR